MSHSSHQVVPVDTDAELLAVQLLAYRVEAELIGSSAIPALHDTLSSLAAARLDRYGVRDGSGLLGAVGVTVQAGVVDIDRLVVAPRAFRRGIGTALVRHVLSLATGDVTVSTGRANAPARALYERCGFVVQGHVEVESGLWVTEYRWSARPVDEKIVGPPR
jgi:ribosomal protein S18 acetylase RimI-like enzyme